MKENHKRRSQHDSRCWEADDCCCPGVHPSVAAAAGVFFCCVAMLRGVGCSREMGQGCSSELETVDVVCELGSRKLLLALGCKCRWGVHLPSYNADGVETFTPKFCSLWRDLGEAC